MKPSSIAPGLCLLTFGLLLSSAQGAPEESTAYFTKNFKLADPSLPTILRTHEVFGRVKAAAALPGRLSPELHIIDPSDNLPKPPPWAIALRDGNIILRKRAVDFCYYEVDELVGDTRLAFVLGHELAHLAKDDYWHSNVYGALAGNPGAESLLALLEETSDAGADQFAEIRAKESQADDWGVLYAGVAGYPVDQLLTDSAGRQGFFHFWLEQTNTSAVVDPLHPSPEDRELLIRSRLSQVVGNLEYYRFGIRLLSFERFDEARHLLEAFAGSFPAPEVFGNLGYVDLRLAMQAMPAKLAYRYWMPALFDVTSRADRLGLRGRGEKLPPEARKLLERAVENLDKATTMDSDYLPAWVNAAIARFYLGDLNLAMHHVGEALRLSPGDAQLEALRAVIIANQFPDLDMSPQAIAQLEALVEADQANTIARYNLARLLEEQARAELADEQWSWLRANAGFLPAPYYRELCSDDGSNCDSEALIAVAPPWDLPVEVGFDTFISQQRCNIPNGDEWQRKDFALGIKGTFYWRAGEAAVLDLNCYVDMVVLYGDELGTAADLLDTRSQPAAVQRVQGGEVWDYGAWKAVIRDGRITEVWVARTEI